MYIGDRIRELRTEKGYSQVEMAERVHVSKQTWYKYENNIVTNIPYDKIEAIAQALNVTPAYLMGWDKSRLPVLGRVAAGVPTEMILDLSYPDAEYLESPDEYCTLEIHGDSMAPGICNGDIVIVHKQADAENGDIIVATINGDDATCKRLQKHNDHLELKPDNEKYSPFLFTPEQVEKMPVRIIGKVVEVRRKV